MHCGKLCSIKSIQVSQMMILQNPFESKSLKMSQNSASVFVSFNASSQTVREVFVFLSLNGI